MSNWSRYLDRSANALRNGLSKMILMQGAEAPVRTPRTLFTFHSQEDINEFATGSDADIGGNSTVHMDLDTTPAHHASQTQQATGKFWGEMRLDVRPGYERKIRGGYAGFRNKRRPTMFGDVVEDVSSYDYLALRLRLGGDPRTKNSYFVNIQTDGASSNDLWQHRLYFKGKDGGWEDIFIPFHNFVRTNAGEVADDQISLYRERVKSIGLSILGGNSGVTGKYEVGIESIRAVNEEDITSEPLQPEEKILDANEIEKGH